jgi:large subunit ribosomal protein L25
MATTNASQYVSLAKTLPPKLQRFFARYPPAQILNALPDGGYPSTSYQQERRNPFQPKKFHPTGRIHNPVYSLRRQADLVKLARENGVEELLPFTPKKTEEQLKHRVKYGLRVKGTGVDQKVKGKVHERQLATKYVLDAWLLCVAIAGWTRADYDTPGWKRGEKPCSRCRHSSGNGKRYVPCCRRSSPNSF